MLGEEATAACPHNVVEHGIIWFEINSMTLSSPPLSELIPGAYENRVQNASCLHFSNSWHVEMLLFRRRPLTNPSAAMWKMLVVPYLGYSTSIFQRDERC